VIGSTAARQSTTERLPLTIHIALGLVVGLSGWLLLALLLPFVPIPVRFLLTWFVFTLGPGMLAAAVLTRTLDPTRRVIVTLGVGSAVTPVIISLLAYANLVPLFPYVASGCLGAGVAFWMQSDRRNKPATSRADAIACAAVAAVALTLGAVVFWHRLDLSGGAVVLYGDYDTADMGYYAAEAAEASHTVPPTASYYSGHKLNAAYYPHLVLGMINRFADVPILPMYYRFAWPTFLMLSALAGFTLVRALAPRRVAVLAVVLLLVGGDLSYLGAWFLQHADLNWDFVLWPTNFLSPTMETPALQHVGTVDAGLSDDAVCGGSRSSDAIDRLAGAQRLPARRAVRVQAVRLCRRDGSARRCHGVLRTRLGHQMALCHDCCGRRGLRTTVHLRRRDHRGERSPVAAAVRHPAVAATDADQAGPRRHVR
jgi:hypothetical protein